MPRETESNENAKNRTNSKNKVVRWFANYWYYYKLPVIIIGVVLIIGIWLTVDIVNNKTADMRVVIISEAAIPETEYEKITSKIEPLVYDVNCDGEVKTQTTYLNLTANPQDEFQIAAYQQVVTVMIDDDITFYIADNHAYNYLKENGALTPLSDFGLSADDEYKIPLNDTFLIEDMDINELSDYYMLFKVWPESLKDDEEEIGRYSMAIALAKELLGEE